MKVRGTLSIVWLLEDGTGVEKPGIYCYAYCRSSCPSIDVDSLISLWTSLKGDVQMSINQIPEPDSFESVTTGSIIYCDVRLDCWPSDGEWRSALEQTLRTIAISEGSVAWCGGEDCTCSPDVLNPLSMGGGNVYAGFAEGVGFLCESPNLSDERKDLSEESLLPLYRVLCGN